MFYLGMREFHFLTNARLTIHTRIIIFSKVILIIKRDKSKFRKNVYSGMSRWIRNRKKSRTLSCLIILKDLCIEQYGNVVAKMDENKLCWKT